MKWILLSLFISTQLWALVPKVPDQELTPGDICTTQDPDYHERRYPERIAYCARNVSFSQREKIYDQYEIPQKCRHRYTIDHLIPLSIGGSNHPSNLWPEHKLIKEQRMDLELEVYELLRDGEISQDSAIRKILREKRSFDGSVEGTSECDQAPFI